MHKKYLDKFKICDSEMLLEFFVFYSRFEYALKQTGFLLERKNAKADWDRFIKKIKDKFDKKKNQELNSAVEYLLTHPARQQVFKDGKLDFVTHGTTSSGSEIKRIYNSIRITRNNLFHGGKYSTGEIEGPERDKALIKNSIIVLKEFIELHQGLRSKFWAI